MMVSFLPMEIIGLAAVDLTGPQRLAMMFPLCLAIAIIYKATRLKRMRDVPSAALVLWGTILIGMYSVGVGLWAVFSLLV